jgi:Spy/CpxP family protein refolding chaperone
MLRLRVGVVVVLALALLAGGGWISVNRADDKPPPKKPTLPYGWTQLKGENKLTALQRQQAYKVRQDYSAKIAELKAKIDQLKDQERAELFKILTPAQKEQLAKILTGSGTKKEPTKESEKPKGTDKIKGKATDK